MIRKLTFALILTFLITLSVYAITVVGSGTQTATLDTEHILYQTTTSNYYTGSVNLTNMASGDITIVRLYKKVLTGSSQDLIDSWTFSGAQTNKIFYLPHVSSPFGAKFTLEQTDGTGRNYDFSIETP